MKHTKLFISTLLITSTLTGCAPQPDAVPTVQEVIEQRRPPTTEEARIYCEKKGGHYETWRDEDGSSNVFCILPEGYGCDPIKFADGSCGRED